MADNNPDWSDEFGSLLSSPLGVELLSELTKRRMLLVAEAELALTPDSAFGLLKEASGVKLAIEHLQFLSAVIPKDEGGQVVS